MSVVPANSVHQFDYSCSVAGATHSSKIGSAGESRIDRRGGKYHGRVRYRLLPQLVGDPGGLQGMGCRRDQVTPILLVRNFTCGL